MICKYCGYHGCDDCMDETKAIEYYKTTNYKNEPHIKRKVVIKPNDMRLKVNRDRFLK